MRTYYKSASGFIRVIKQQYVPIQIQTEFKSFYDKYFSELPTKNGLISLNQPLPISYDLFVYWCLTTCDIKGFT